MIKITIVDTDEDKILYDGEFEDMTWTLERGVDFIYSGFSYSPTDIVPNGHLRAEIKLWSGCTSWETFRTGRMVN